MNLDPFETETDENLEELLRKAGLEDLLERVDDEEDDKKKVENPDPPGRGLYFKIKEKGSNLSSGEKQLICICRAILQTNRVVLLDEATANIDIKTEQNIQKMISSEFAGSTVITIAHRLNTIIQSDKVMVLE